jgi:predicted Zn-dependent protease
MSGVDKIQNSLIGLSTRLRHARAVGSGQSASAQSVKGFGDPPPPLADIRNNALLMSLFTLQGLVGRLKKKLKQASGKNGIIIPAKGIIACAGKDDQVYLGVEFLEKYQHEEETIAGVLAHEWGHLISKFTEMFDPNELNWDQIAQIRKEEEARADATAGRLLHKMGYSPEGLIRLLTHPKFQKETQKYYSPQERAQIIQLAFDAQKRLVATSQRLQFFNSTIYHNPDQSRIIATG